MDPEGNMKGIVSQSSTLDYIMRHVRSQGCWYTCNELTTIGKANFATNMQTAQRVSSASANHAKERKFAGPCLFFPCGFLSVELY